jgi:hypothetical protein
LEWRSINEAIETLLEASLPAGRREA